MECRLSTFAKQPSSVLSQLLKISNTVRYKKVIKPICLSSALFKCSTFLSLAVIFSSRFGGSR